MGRQLIIATALLLVVQSPTTFAEDDEIKTRVKRSEGTLTVSHGYDTAASCKAYVNNKLVASKTVAPGEAWVVQNDELRDSFVFDSDSYNAVCTRGSAIVASQKSGFNKRWVVFKNVSNETWTCRVSRKGSLFRKVKTRDIVLTPGQKKEFSKGTFDAKWDCTLGEEYTGDWMGYDGVWGPSNPTEG